MELPFRITVCGLDELALHAGARVSHVLSILDPAWPVPEVFGAYGEHEKLELRFDDVIEEVPGKAAPLVADVEALLAFGRKLDAERNAHLLVHCHAGVSRSTASMALLLAQAMPHLPGDAVFAKVLRIRPMIWPNLRIVEMGDALLGRRGEMVASVREVYWQQMAKHPGLAADFTAMGRGREVAAGKG
jgi:predicted protein tyrosine phosphatase